jgi:hypothetical protein
MAKSNRRKKQDRAKATAKQAVARRRRTMTAWLRAAEQRLERIYDPATPAAELAALLAEQYAGTPVAGWLASALLEEGSSVERLQHAARAMTEADQADEGEPSLTTLTFAAAVARAAGDATEERCLIDQALAAADRADDPDVRLEVVDFISVSGHPAWAVELLEPRLRAAPDDEFAARLYGAAIERTDEKAGEPESAVLRRFADRSGLIALQDAVSAFLAGTELGAAVQARVTDELSAADDLGWTPEERAAFGRLAEELAWLTADPEHDEDDVPDDARDLLAEDDPSGTPLRAFAADPSTPSALAARAVAWYEHIHYGLWRIDDPVLSPGLWCTDIVTGTERYVEFPAEATAVLPRWSVWLGGIVPVDGIWRSTGLGVRLSPAEGDAAAEFVGQASVAVLYALEGKPERPPTSIPFGEAEPHGVYADLEEPSSSEAADMMGKVIGALVTSIAAGVHQNRATPPAIANTDGDPMCLITATIAAGAGVAEKLAARRDFDVDADDPSRITWWGALIPEGQRKAMMAEAVAQMRAEGHKHVEVPEGPQRWVRGALRVRDGEIIAELNSRQRLARLLDILRKVGADPVVTAEKRIDPALDFGWPAGERATQGGAAPAAEGWEKHWLDEKIPALHGRTPRQAAGGREWPYLEALLRQFEYEADLLAAEGKSGIDTAWLREELNMPSALDD